MATSTATIPLSPRALCSLNDLSLHRGITIGDTDGEYNKDEMLTRLINAVSRQVERITRRRFVRGDYTEYFDGAQYPYSIPLSAYPIVSITYLYDDPNHSYSAALSSSIYEADARTGWLKLFKGGRFSNALKNVKCVYTGGYALYQVEAGVNDQIVVNDDSTNWLTATIPESDNEEGYTAEELADAIETAVNALANFGDTLTVTYDSTSGKFTLSSDGSTFEILADTSNANWSTRVQYFADLIGITHGNGSSNNKTGATEYEAGSRSGSLPEDLTWAVAGWVAFLFEQTGGDGGGDNRFGVSGTGGDKTNMNYYMRSVPKYIMDVVNDYSAGRL